jgi:hypothetical protein
MRIRDENAKPSHRSTILFDGEEMDRPIHSPIAWVNLADRKQNF